jgi:hypothetical protein
MAAITGRAAGGSSQIGELLGEAVDVPLDRASVWLGSQKGLLLGR